MATLTPNKGGILELGTYKIHFGAVNSDGGGATYATDDFNIAEVLDNVDLTQSAKAVRVGGTTSPRNAYTEIAQKSTVRIHLPYGGPISTGKVGLPIKFTRQTWNDLAEPAVALEGALLSRRESGRNGESVFEELEIDFNPHWAVEEVA